MKDAFHIKLYKNESYLNASFDKIKICIASLVSNKRNFKFRIHKSYYTKDQNGATKGPKTL